MTMSKYKTLKILAGMWHQLVGEKEGVKLAFEMIFDWILDLTRFLQYMESEETVSITYWQACSVSQLEKKHRRCSHSDVAGEGRDDLIFISF
ncbi:hypothetical protein MRB53_002876 [Persea americana]|uniref:Uncharacterized protein n=1 Tax=Persea americana TaxID=3435 RepID=A0ACC2MW34_PERAE|nr:hypothetical protein MRB53_002876 [Persea americana]